LDFFDRDLAQKEDTADARFGSDGDARNDLQVIDAVILDGGDDTDICFPLSHCVRAPGRSGELEFMLALLPAMKHAPNQRHTIKVLNN
jgi:hypothetical protein